MEEAAAGRSGPATPSPGPADPVLVAPSPTNQPPRILGRNVNGTVVQTSMPQNEAELQLYRVMQRASLLSYYDTLLEMGGDDVQQLCDAGEEEFLEIMALVGMASKPLHVRRLQKALQEWLTNPGMFQTPVLAPGKKSVPGVACSFSPGSARPTEQLQQQQPVVGKLGLAAGPGPATPPIVVAQPGVAAVAGAAQLLGQFSATAGGCCPLQPRNSLSPPTSFAPVIGQPASSTPTDPQPHINPAAAALPLSHSPGVLPVASYESSSCGSQGTTPSPSSNCAMANAPQSPTTCLQTTPILLESQVQRLAEAAEKLAATIRPLNPKPPSGIKKKICKNLEMVMAMSDGDPRKVEEIRKYAAIYGRFDCKRKPEKPLTLHEVSVNEAAAQICRFVPALLTRRDELFPLARRVVRDSGHFFNKNLMHPSSNTPPRTTSSSRGENGDGELSASDETSATGPDSIKRRKLDMRCDEDSVSGNGEQAAESTPQQSESARLRYSSYSRGGAIAIDSDSNSAQAHRNRHRKRQRRRRSSKRKTSPVWQTCSDGGNAMMDGVVDGLDDSDGCYSSSEDDWDNCNNDDDNFDIDADDDAGDDEDDDETPVSLMHEVQNRTAAQVDDVSSMMDKENDFNLKVIASCGDNIIAVANPALMNRNQPAITKEQPIKEEIALRDRRD